MTEKAATKVAVETAPVATNGHKPARTIPDYRLIPWKDLQTSPTNPRRRIDDTTIESLAASIKSQDILEPLIVREKGKKYEIVCGERRYRAAKIAEVGELPCLVRELTDEQVLDIQIHENLHREDVHPMDEAYGYQFLKEKLGCDVRELVLRVGKSEGYVLNRLKLNGLIKEAQADIDDGHLPLVYALEIAKYTPEIQQVIYAEVYNKRYEYKKDKYTFVPIKGQTVPWKSFTEWINTNVHRVLVKAPFNTKATNLREDGLACIKCTERTGAAATLFEPNQIGKKDACLNPDCFKQKVENYVAVRRRELAELSKIEPSEVPIVRSWSHSNGESYLGSESAIVVGDIRGGTKRKCKNTVSGIDIEPENYGQTVQVCLKSTNCRIHWQTAKAATNGRHADGKSDEAKAAASLEAHRARREEIWNAKVADAVRVRVFKQAAEKFEKKFRITEIGTDFLPQLIARFWRMMVSGDNNNLNNIVKSLVAEWSGVPAKDNGIYLSDGPSGIEYVKKLEREMQFRILFLLVHCHKGAIGYSNSYSSQKEVKELATEFAIDYQMIDAEVRLEHSAKKHVTAHESYLEAVRTKDKTAKIPWLFSEKWNANN
jgi:ParB family chromosome partitioning protein